MNRSHTHTTKDFLIRRAKGINEVCWSPNAKSSFLAFQQPLWDKINNLGTRFTPFMVKQLCPLTKAGAACLTAPMRYNLKAAGALSWSVWPCWPGSAAHNGFITRRWDNALHSDHPGRSGTPVPPPATQLQKQLTGLGFFYCQGRQCRQIESV